MDTKLLEDFRDMRIFKTELYSKLNESLVEAWKDEPLTIYTDDVVKLLVSYRDGVLSFENMLDWVNVIWFSEFYDYDDIQCDSIASIMNILEELDEGYITLTNADIERYIAALQSNQEIL